jgi:hypothetical protein
MPDLQVVFIGTRTYKIILFKEISARLDHGLDTVIFAIKEVVMLGGVCSHPIQKTLHT